MMVSRILFPRQAYVMLFFSGSALIRGWAVRGVLKTLSSDHMHSARHSVFPTVAPYEYVVRDKLWRSSARSDEAGLS